MTTAVANYRIFSLPQSGSRPEDRRFRRALIIGIGLWALLILLVTSLPKPERSKALEVPESVKIMMQPPPPKPVEQKKPEEKPKEDEQPKPEPLKNPEKAKQIAQKEIDKINKQLDALQDILKLAEPVADVPLDAKVDGPTKVDRSLIASNVTGGASGINTAALASGVAGGGGTLDGHTTGKVQGAGVDVAMGAAQERKTASGKTGRSREEIDQYLDKNKSALYTLYNRAVRENPDMQGVVEVKMTIAPTGEVSNCLISKSQLNNEDFEKKLCQRIKLFKFENKDVAPLELTKPYSFFPASE